MSWTMWHINGTGFDIGQADPEKFGRFILNHKESLRKGNCKFADELIEYISAGLSEDNADAIDMDEMRDMTDVFSLAEPVAVIMWQETGLTYTHPGLTEDCEDYVLFCAAFPWEYRDAEKALSSIDDLVNVMKPYAEEMGLKVEPDVDLVYSG